MLACILTVALAAPVPKDESADWKAALKERGFKFQPQPTRAADSVAAAEQTGLAASFTLDPRDTFDGTFALAKQDGPEVTFRGHRFTPVVVRGDALYVAEYSTIASGCTVVAYDLTTGKKAWARPLEGLGPVCHSKYRNYATMAVERHPDTKAAFALVVTGWEAAGGYVEVIDLITGKQLANKKFEDVGLPKP